MLTTSGTGDRAVRWRNRLLHHALLLPPFFFLTAPRIVDEPILGPWNRALDQNHVILRHELRHLQAERAHGFIAVVARHL